MIFGVLGMGVRVGVMMMNVGMVHLATICIIISFLIMVCSDRLKIPSILSEMLQ